MVNYQWENNSMIVNITSFTDDSGFKIFILINNARPIDIFLLRTGLCLEKKKK